MAVRSQACSRCFLALTSSFVVIGVTLSARLASATSVPGQQLYIVTATQQLCPEIDPGEYIDLIDTSQRPAPVLAHCVCVFAIGPEFITHSIAQSVRIESGPLQNALFEITVAVSVDQMIALTKLNGRKLTALVDVDCLSTNASRKIDQSNVGCGQE